MPVSESSAFHDGGFSLTEVIVAMFIAGLAMAIVLVSLPKGTDQLEQTKSSLVARIEMARDLSRTTGEAYGLDIAGDDIRTVRLSENAWQITALAGDTPTFAVSAPIYVVLPDEADRRREEKSKIGKDEDDDIVPEIWFDPSGIASSVPVTLVRKNERYVISVERNGAVHASFSS